MRPQRFDTEYWTGMGVLAVFGEDFVVLIRMSDGYCKRFSWDELLPVKAGAEQLAKAVPV